MNNLLILILVGMVVMGGNHLFSHVSPPSIAMTEKLENRVAPLLEKKYKMRLCGSGGGMPDGIVNMLSLSFDSYRIASIEEARPILVDCVNIYMNAVNADKELKPYLKNAPFTPENIKISIYFNSPQGEEVYDPYLSVASTLCGKLIYRTKEKGKIFGYKSEVIESYEDAVKILNKKKNTPQ